MTKYLIAFMICLPLSLAVLAQDSASSDTAEAGSVQVQGADTEDQNAGETDSVELDTEEVDDADLDEQTYEDDDDDFIPTEEIPIDEPIPFPTNI